MSDVYLEEPRRVRLSDYPDPPFTAYVNIGWQPEKITVTAINDSVVTSAGEGGMIVVKDALHPTFDAAKARLMEVARVEYKRAARRLAAVAALIEEEGV